MPAHTLQGQTAGAGTVPAPIDMSWKGNGHPSWHHRSAAVHSGKTGCLSQKDPADGPKAHGQGGGPVPCAEHASHSMSMGFVRK